MNIGNRFVPTALALAAAMATTLAARPARAQDAGKGSEVTVTGSRIKGGVEAAALPVHLITVEELRQQGSPIMVELVKALPEVAGVMGDSNQFAPERGQGMEGSGGINLRGLGPNRTLILLNGHRLPLTSGYINNSHNIPTAALGRVEVLRDGAAATYGSDAIGGVVNFITKKNVNGFEGGASFRDIRGAKGDFDAELTWGKSNERFSVLLAAGFQHRSELQVLDRKWSPLPYAQNPNAGWSFSVNPSQFVPVGPVGPNGTLGATGARAVDSGCAPLGGVQPFAGFCVQQFTVWENLVEKQDSYQLFGRVDAELGKSTRMFAEAYFANSHVPHVGYPPSFNQPKPVTETVLPSNINPATYVAGTSPRLFNNWFVPITNPGLAAYAAANPSQFPAGSTGIFIPIGQWRPYFVGGNPLYDGGGGFGVRKQDEFRLSAGLSGEWGNGLDWEATATFGQNKHYLKGADTAGTKLQLALRGLGGANCDFRTGTPGVGGCQWLNPMSNAIAGAPNHGAPSNPGYNAAVANTKELAAWLMQDQESWLTSRVIEIGGSVSGQLSSLKLGGGAPSWVAGAQFRRNEFSSTYSRFADRAQVPCLNSALNIPGADNCTPTPNTPLGLAVANNAVDVAANVASVFGELELPLSKLVNLNAAARFEDYGAKGGNTFNPQLRGKFQAQEWLALRGSVGSTFRAPPVTQLNADDAATTLQNVLGTFRAADLIGNPKLKPETSKTYNVGVLVNFGGFEAAIDHYNYEVDDIITNEPLNNVVAALFPNGAAGANNCGTLDPAFIASHFVFAGACSAANLTRVLLSRINGPTVTISGVDLKLSHLFRGVVGGDLKLGVGANAIQKYRYGAFTAGSLEIPALNAIGKLNVGTLAHPLPRTKIHAYANYSSKGFNVRWTTRHNSAYTDPRTTPDVNGYKIPSTTLHDLSLQVEGPYRTTLSLTVNNLFDKDPAFARTEYSYDALTGDPLGRTVKLAMRMRF